MIKGAEDDAVGAASLGPASAPSRSETRDRALAPGARRGSDAPVAEPWRDALLRLSLDLPVEASFDELARCFVERLMPVLPTLAIGACIVTAPGSEPVVVVRHPPGLVLEPDRDPTRLFPRAPEERIFELSDGAVGSTFHVACPGATEPLSPFHVQVAERAALVLAAAIARTRVFQSVHGSEERLDELRARVIQSEKLASLGQIVAGVVHELNNPLTSILAYAHHLTRKLGRRDDIDGDDLERLRRIAEAAERIQKFSRDLVAYARPTSDVPGIVWLEEIVEKALIFCEHEFEANAIRVEKTLAPRLPPLLGFSSQLTQVFVNLFTNSVHAMNERGGLLRVEALVNAPENALVVQVLDTGSGIAAAHLPQIFEPFFTTKPDGRGTGLGLSIVRDIVDAHGGTVAVQSTVGRGTTFTLTLPLG